MTSWLVSMNMKEELLFTNTSRKANYITHLFTSYVYSVCSKMSKYKYYFKKNINYIPYSVTSIEL